MMKTLLGNEFIFMLIFIYKYYSEKEMQKNE